ncbi:hypothetical protein AAVH_34019 [Aphelenchoides avenae]|nr:hypothetical protein AAVH_34019 [Aphelenchus avenae]
MGALIGSPKSKEPERVIQPMSSRTTDSSQKESSPAPHRSLSDMPVPAQQLKLVAPERNWRFFPTKTRPSHSPVTVHPLLLKWFHPSFRAFPCLPLCLRRPHRPASPRWRPLWPHNRRQSTAANPPKPGLHLVPEKAPPANKEEHRPRYARSAAAVNGVPEVRFKSHNINPTFQPEVRGLFVTDITPPDKNAVLRACRGVPNANKLLSRVDRLFAIQLEIEDLEIRIRKGEANVRQRADHWCMCALLKSQLQVYHENGVM